MGKLKDLLASYTQLVRGAQYLYSLLEAQRGVFGCKGLRFMDILYLSI